MAYTRTVASSMGIFGRPGFRLAGVSDFVVSTILDSSHKGPTLTPPSAGRGKQQTGNVPPGSIVVTRTPVPCRSERRPNENWLTKALVPP